MPSEKLAMERSRGMRTPCRCAAAIAPAATISLVATTAVGGSSSASNWRSPSSPPGL
ncbi:Uncharacterised protein [Bordetella pertussis]|nr:Uncharacterised protein [Bordetella pertussis]